LLGSRKERLDEDRDVALRCERASPRRHNIRWRMAKAVLANAKRVCLLTIVVLSSDGASPPKKWSQSLLCGLCLKRASPRQHTFYGEWRRSFTGPTLNAFVADE
jgi:hypothetical protein